jgi:hypothetical protein
VERAEILDITAEAPIGSLLRGSKTSPEILKALHWIQNTLADGDGSIPFGDYPLEERLEDVNGCQVTFVHAHSIFLEDPTSRNLSQLGRSAVKFDRIGSCELVSLGAVV